MCVFACCVAPQDLWILFLSEAQLHRTIVTDQKRPMEILKICLNKRKLVNSNLLHRFVLLVQDGLGFFLC